MDEEERYTELIIGSSKTKNSILYFLISGELMKILKPVMKVVDADIIVLDNNAILIEFRNTETIL